MAGNIQGKFWKNHLTSSISDDVHVHVTDILLGLHVYKLGVDAHLTDLTNVLLLGCTCLSYLVEHAILLMSYRVVHVCCRSQQIQDTL